MKLSYQMKSEKATTGINFPCQREKILILTPASLADTYTVGAVEQMCLDILNRYT